MRRSIVASLGLFSDQLCSYNLAVAFLEQATFLEPMDAVITGLLGDAYWETGRSAEARFKWQYALSIATEDDLKAEFTAKLKQSSRLLRLPKPIYCCAFADTLTLAIIFLIQQVPLPVLAILCRMYRQTPHDSQSSVN